MIKDQIIKALQEIVGIRGVNLEFPENEEFGDYSSNVALVLAKKEGKNPQELAEDFVKKINKASALPAIAEPKADFINFWLKEEALVKNLAEIDREKEKYGTSSEGKGKTVVIDYSSPNIAKLFGIGHLRSTLIGQALYNLYKALGYEVVGDNHLGDWGTQFGSLLAEITNSKLQIADLTIDKLEELYVEFNRKAEGNPRLEEEARSWFKKLEKGNPEAKRLWQACVDVSLKEFNRIYDMLGVKIDFAFGESYYEGEIRQMMADSKIKKFFTRGKDGALIIDLAKEGIATPLMFLKKDGATTYATRDLATIRFRVRKWDPSIVIYEVGAEQSLYFKQVFAAARLLGLVGKGVELVHTAHGLYLAPDGKKFSTRKGKTVRLEEVLNEAIERAKKLQKDRPASAEATARQVGIAAIKYFDLMHSVQSNVVFDWEKMMNLEGNSGPYLQYTVARTNSVLAKSTNKQIYKSANKWQMENGKWRINDEELAVLRSLIKFSDVIEMSAKLYSPNLLCNYLYDLASKFNTFYNKYRILGGEAENFRLSLTFATGQVLKNGLKILGIQTPEKM
jgi:arginyl-tRNA synthetase